MKKEMLLFGLVSLILFISGCSSTATGNAIAETDFVKIPLSDLSSTAQFYEYDAGGVRISYFAVLGSDGQPRVAFDACDVCGGSKGYQQKGSDIECRNCGRVFSIDGLGTKNKGYGCWPSYLPAEVSDGIVFIKISDIRAGKSRFV